MKNLKSKSRLALLAILALSTSVEAAENIASENNIVIREKLDRSWKEDRYNDFMKTYQEALSVNPDMLSDEDKFNSSLIIFKNTSDLDQTLDNLEGSQSVKNKTAVVWLKTLQEAHTSERAFIASFDSLIREAKERSLRNMSTFDIARRSLRYASSIQDESPEAAKIIAKAFANNPVFGKFSSDAKLLYSEMKGEDLKTIKEQNTKENNAHVSYLEMLKTWNSGDREGAIAKAMEIIKNYPGTYTCDNTCMQLGYYLIRQGEYTPAKQVFTDTLSSLEKYGLDNPMAVEAKRSIRNLKIAMNYENPDDMPKDDVINSALGFVEEYPDDLDGHLQLAGSLFEKVQVSIITNTPFDQELWDQMIATLTLISETPGKKL